MLMTIAFVGMLCAALALVLAPAWLASTAAYLAIIVLTVLTLIMAELRNTPSAIDSLVIGVDLIIFGLVFYFVTVQKLMKRRVSQVTSLDDFKSEMQAQGRFQGAIRGLYYLPFGLLLGGIAIAVLGSIAG